MKLLLRVISLTAMLAGGGAFAAEPDPHAGHHPAPTPITSAPATPPAQPDAATAEIKPDMTPACPMMEGKAMDGKAMDDHKMHCMHARSAADAAEPKPHDHAPK